MSLFGDKNMQAVPGRSPIGVKTVKLPNWGHDPIFWQKNHSISVINNFFLDHLNKRIGKKLDFDVLKGLD